VAVLRSGELIVPHGELEFQTEDEVLAVVHKDQKKELAHFFDRIV
jgi:Trk K+ transport system NAD-binding subunit